MESAITFDVEASVAIKGTFAKWDASLTRSLRFIHEASNVIFLGPPGVGKTHLSVALAEEAIRSGLGAYFITAGGESQGSSRICRSSSEG